MQDICDEIGIIVMDELFDMWTVHKNNHDFALHFLDEWEKVMQWSQQSIDRGSCI